MTREQLIKDLDEAIKAIEYYLDSLKIYCEERGITDLVNPHESSISERIKAGLHIKRIS